MQPSELSSPESSIWLTLINSQSSTAPRYAPAGLQHATIRSTANNFQPLNNTFYTTATGPGFSQVRESPFPTPLAGEHHGLPAHTAHRDVDPSSRIASLNLNDPARHVVPIGQVQQTSSGSGKAKEVATPQARPQTRLEPDDKGLLYEEFKKSPRPRRFFVIGRVFLTLWSEPGGGASRTAGTSKAWTKNQFGEWVFSKVRRFVVIKEGSRSCTAVPVLTYNGQGVAKKGVKKSDHVVLYSGRHPPTQVLQEQPAAREAGMQQQPIRVDQDHKHEKLDQMSRVDLAKPQTVQHYYKVKSFGKVNRDFVPWLLLQFRKVQFDETNSSPVLLRSVGLGNLEKSDQSLESLLGNAKYRAAYDALVALKYTPEQAAQYLQQGAKALQCGNAASSDRKGNTSEDEDAEAEEVEEEDGDEGEEDDDFSEPDEEE